MTSNFIIKNGILKKYLGNDSHVEIPNGVTEIGKFAFYNHYNLESISIPDTVTKIGESAFDGCSNLKGIDVPDSVTEVGPRAFFGVPSSLSVIIWKE